MVEHENPKPTKRKEMTMISLFRILFVVTFTVCFILPRTGLAGQIQNTPGDTSDTRPVTVGTSFKIHSKICGNDRIVMVGLPAGYAESQKRYPVFIAVDGQWLFNISCEAARGLSDNGVIPQMIVVGIHTLERRSFYLLPASDPVSHTVGADSLFAFIREELIPYMDTHYRTLPRRVLTGTSYGGIFVMHALLMDPNLFDVFITMSPSMWWNDAMMLKRTEAFMKANTGMHNALYVTVANEGQGMGVNALSEILKQHAPRGLAWRFDEYPEEIHETISYKSIYNGLKFAFSDWRPSRVRFETKGDLLAAGDTVRISLAGAGQSIRYALDGSNPSEKSPLYEKPLIVTQPVTLKALPVFGLGMPGNSDSIVVRLLPRLKSEIQTPALIPGLRYTYAEGRWDTLPDASTIRPVKTGVAANFEMSQRKRDAQFAMRYTGYLDVKESGVIQFALTSDDGSRLTIGDQVVVTNDGTHGMIEKTGKVYLEKGMHRIEIFFFQNDGGFGLNLEYESSSIPRQKIPISAFSCPAATEP
jgi:predicted alpha/beta superfamily hydrolase